MIYHALSASNSPLGDHGSNAQLFHPRYESAAARILMLMILNSSEPVLETCDATSYVENREYMVSHRSLVKMMNHSQCPNSSGV